jgi:hypothetical protein
MSTQPKNLTELMHAMKTARTADAFASYGLPVRHGVPDWTSLPTFGGDEPDDTVEVWSWDADETVGRHLPRRSTTGAASARHLIGSNTRTTYNASEVEKPGFCRAFPLGNNLLEQDTLNCQVITNHLTWI